MRLGMEGSRATSIAPSRAMRCCRRHVQSLPGIRLAHGYGILFIHRTISSILTGGLITHPYPCASVTAVAIRLLGRRRRSLPQ